MTTELNFQFEELGIDQKRLMKNLGFEEDQLHEPFSSYLKQVNQECSSLHDIRASFVIIDQIEIRRNTVAANGLEFRVGNTIGEELTGSQKLAFFVCTAGQEISDRATGLLQGEDPVLGYVYDAMGSELVEAVGNKIQQMIQEVAAQEGLKITNRYSPGYCHWAVADQQKIFSILNGKTCGIALNESSLMYPVKSISGVIGIGKEVAYHDYQCRLCKLENCVYRTTSMQE